MWYLSFLPDSLLLYIVNGVLIVGAIGSFFSFFLLHRVVRWFPAIAPYHLILQIVSAVLLVVGIYFKGGYGVEMSWREKVADLEAKVKIAEEKSQQVNTVIQTKVVEKIKVVKDVQVVLQDRIVKVKEKIDAECKVAPEAIIIHNDAAKTPEKEKK
jgi:preprotein translocase subunit SecF